MCENWLADVFTQVLELGEELMGAGYEVLAEVHPWTEVVNSVIVLRVKVMEVLVNGVI